VDALKAEARAELVQIEALGGAVAAVDSGHMKRALVESNAARLRAIESGKQIVVGVNAYTESEPSPLAAGGAVIETIPESVEAEQIARLEAWRAARDGRTVAAALDELRAAAGEGRNVMEPSIRCARAGVTTGEWGQALRDIFGEYRAPTGIGVQTGANEDLAELRAAVARVSDALGTRLKILVGKPGLDGHSNGAEQISVRARDVGMEVVYEGIRLTPARIAKAALEEGVHVVGLSILSGSHLALAREVVTAMRALGLDQVPVVVGGIIPAEDAEALKALGIAAVYTPKDYRLNAIMADIVRIVEARAAALTPV
jgi:(2R)-ethylmalonyl-CoA mutase